MEKRWGGSGAVTPPGKNGEVEINRVVDFVEKNEVKFGGLRREVC